MRKSKEQMIEELSLKVGGRFKLTALVQKKTADYVKGGRTFMPDVRNLDELFIHVLNEVEEGRIRLSMPDDALDKNQLQA